MGKTGVTRWKIPVQEELAALGGRPIVMLMQHESVNVSTREQAQSSKLFQGHWELMHESDFPTGGATSHHWACLYAAVHHATARYNYDVVLTGEVGGLDISDLPRRVRDAVEKKMRREEPSGRMSCWQPLTMHFGRAPGGDIGQSLRPRLFMRPGPPGVHCINGVPAVWIRPETLFGAVSARGGALLKVTKQGRWASYMFGHATITVAMDRGLEVAHINFKPNEMCEIPLIGGVSKTVFGRTKDIAGAIDACVAGNNIVVDTTVMSAVLIGMLALAHRLSTDLGSGRIVNLSREWSHAAVSEHGTRAMEGFSITAEAIRLCHHAGNTSIIREDDIAAELRSWATVHANRYAEHVVHTMLGVVNRMHCAWDASSIWLAGSGRRHTPPSAVTPTTNATTESKKSDAKRVPQRTFTVGQQECQNQPGQSNCITIKYCGKTLKINQGIRVKLLLEKAREVAAQAVGTMDCEVTTQDHPRDLLVLVVGLKGRWRRIAPLLAQAIVGRVINVKKSSCAEIPIGKMLPNKGDCDAAVVMAGQLTIPRVEQSREVREAAESVIAYKCADSAMLIRERIDERRAWHRQRMEQQARKAEWLATRSGVARTQGNMSSSHKREAWSVKVGRANHHHGRATSHVEDHDDGTKGEGCSSTDEEEKKWGPIPGINEEEAIDGRAALLSTSAHNTTSEPNYFGVTWRG